jgi:hypothetical protein
VSRIPTLDLVEQNSTDTLYAAYIYLNNRRGESLM